MLDGNALHCSLFVAEGATDGPHRYVVEQPHRYPISLNCSSEIAAALGRVGKVSAPTAFHWDDVVCTRRRGRPLARRLRRLCWPDPEPLLASQVTAAGRCAIRADVLDRLFSEGKIGRRNDTSAAFAVQCAEDPGRLSKLADVFRFVPSEGDPVYLPVQLVTAPSRADSVSVVINYRDRPELVESCLSSLASQLITATVEIILIDNQSRPESRAAVEAAARMLPSSFSVRHLEYDAPFNKSAQDNMGAEVATGDVVVFLNNDARLLDRGVLQGVSDWAMTPGVATVGPRFVGNGGRLVSSGVQTRPAENGKDPIIRESEVIPLSQTVHYSAGASLAFAGIRRDLWLEMGGMDTEVFRAQHNDSDFDIRALDRGLRHLYLGNFTVFHEPGRTEQRTKQMILELRTKLIARYPHMGRYCGLDPNLQPLSHVPAFGDDRVGRRLAWGQSVDRAYKLGGDICRRLGLTL